MNRGALAYSRYVFSTLAGLPLQVNRIGERVRRRVSRLTESGVDSPSPDTFRSASASAMRRTRRVGVSARFAAADAVSGAVEAANEISGEATGFVRDAVNGVMQGAGQVAKVSRPMVRDIVAAAVRRSTELGGNMPEASQRAVEGAMVGAAATGFETKSAGPQASAGVVKAVRELGGDFRDVVAPAIHGVVIGVISTSRDLFDPTRNTAASLLESGMNSGEDAVDVARLIAGEAIKASRLYRVESTDAIMGAAQGCVEAAYRKGSRVGDAVRFAVMDVVNAPVSALGPSISDAVSEGLTELSEEMRGRPQAWRGVAMWRAAKSLYKLGAIDIGAALAYYILLALFPLVGLIILALSVFVDHEVIQATVTEVVVFYFPNSKEFLGEVTSHLFTVRLAASLIAIAAMLFGAQGLFMAANRGVNRVFDREPRRLFGATVSTFAIILFAIALFQVSVGITFAFQAAIDALDGIPTIGVTLNRGLILIAYILSLIAPFLVGCLVFVVVYRLLPNQFVGWGNATFGGVVAVIMFEIAKYGFVFFANFASQRSLLYGSMSSVVLLLLWSHLAGMIFLYGAAITKHASDLRPQAETTLKRRAARMNVSVNEVEARRRRRADIARGRETRAPNNRYGAERAGRYPDPRSRFRR